MGNTSSTSKSSGKSPSTHPLRRTNSNAIQIAASTLLAPAAPSHRRSRSAGPGPAPYAPPPGYHESVGLAPASSASAPSGSARRSAPIQDKAEYLRTPMRRETLEDVLETLRMYDTVLIVDDSLSMTWDGRWEETREALSSLAAVTAEYDPDGIDIHFLNSSESATQVGAKAVEELFERVRPTGGTPIGRRLDVLLGRYMDDAEANKAARKATKPVNFIVLTDGKPTDSPEDVIVAIARRLDQGKFPLSQLGIQFVQIGASRSAGEYLRGLDDNLVKENGIRDIVDTTPYTLMNGKLTAEMLLKILVGGINRRVDREGAKDVI